MLRLLTGLVFLLGACAGAADLNHTFKKIRLTDKFWAEGANYADFNRDGKMDVVVGPYWYEGPDFHVRHEFYPANASFKRKKSDGTEETIEGFEGGLGTVNAYSDNFLTFTYDFNGDGWPDVLVYGFPGKEAFWYENPKNRQGHWQRFFALGVVDNESPDLADIDGDGKPDILCCSEGYIGYATADWKHPHLPWTFHAVSPKGDYQRFTHGIGSGDINGDGRVDILEKDGWWEQPASLAKDPVWIKHAFPFAERAAEMCVYDVDGDGLNDVITSLDAHGYGLAWYQQFKTNDQISFRQHLILNKTPEKNAYSVSFTQPHSLCLIDVDGDGLKDIVTGKRFWAHGPHGADPESDEPAVLYWFQLQRPQKGAAQYLPHLIDSDSGVGTQVVAGFLSNKKFPDIIVGNKKGAFLFEPQIAKNSSPKKHQAKSQSKNP
jgi:hypothetical protein